MRDAVTLLGLAAALVAGSALSGCDSLQPGGPGPVGSGYGAYGPPPPPPVEAQGFDPDAFAWSQGAGAGALTGKVAYHAASGEHWTCAGQTIALIPATRYSAERMEVLYGSHDAAVVPAAEVRARNAQSPGVDYGRFVRTASCDGHDAFSFADLQPGPYFLIARARPKGHAAGPDEGVVVMQRVPVGAGLAHSGRAGRLMRFDERFVEEIKARLRPSDVIGRTVKLKRAGREYVGLSPFTKEKTPSFYVNDEKGFFHDFSSGKHGDVIGFLQETARLSFREAVEILAAEAGLALPTPDPREAEAEHRRQDLHGWMEEAAKWFEAQLRRPPGDTARRYLDGRALPEDERNRFRLGYASASRTALKDHLIAKGATPGDLVETGLLIAPEDGGAPYDRFRDRIMFPITDGRGRIVSFGGRALDPQARAKYLNGPETALFHKGSTLYGLPEARRLLHTSAGPGGEDAALVVVEGYMDAIACQRAGIAAVAPLGTALTEEQMAALWRLAAEPVLCFDGDAAGQRAAYKAIDRALPLLKPGRSFRFAAPAGGKDPDEILREKGAAALKAALTQTRPLSEVLFERERAEAEPLDTPERRTALKVALRKLASTIADPDLAHAYRDDLLARFEALWPVAQPVFTRADAARAMRGDRRGPRRAPVTGASAEGKAAARRLSASLPPHAAAAAAGVLSHPELADEQLEALDVQGFGEAALAAFAHAFIELRLTWPTLDSAGMQRHLIDRGFAETLEDIAKGAARADAPFLRPDLPVETARALWSQLFDALIRLAALERALGDAKSDIASNPNDFGEFYGLKAERDALKREPGAGTFWTAGLSNDGEPSIH